MRNRRFPSAVRERAEAAFREELEAMPLDTLVTVVDTLVGTSWRLWRPMRLHKPGLWADCLDVATDYAAQNELAMRAQIAREWREWPECFRSFFRAWNGADVPFFDGVHDDIEVYSFVESSVRARVIEAVRDDTAPEP